MAIQEINDATFETETKNGLVLIDFWAEWCGPCRMIAPILEEIDQERSNEVKIMKMDVDKNNEIPAKFNIMSIPTLMVKKDGEIKETITGLRPKEELNEMLSKYV